MNIDMSGPEVTFLRQVLSDRLGALRQEVRHTDAHEFKAELKQRQQVLERLISKLPS
jgi:hypothetical protein